jgi:hypothetical protein
VETSRASGGRREYPRAWRSRIRDRRLGGERKASNESPCGIRSVFAIASGRYQEHVEAMCFRQCPHHTWMIPPAYPELR